MQIQQQTGGNIGVQISPAAEHGYDDAVQRDLEFLRAWEDGKFPDLYCYLYVRQIRKGNPMLVAQQILGKVNVQKTHPLL